MHIINKSEAPIFSMPGATFTGLAAPSRGATETAVWHARIAPGTPGLMHRVTREELFFVLSGRGVVSMDGNDIDLNAGATLIVPPEKDFAISNPHADALEVLAILPIGGQACIGQEAPFTPPWAA